jgi:hypothetical protein
LTSRKKVSLSEQDGVVGKECTKCDTWKPLEQFNTKSNGLGKKSSRCKSCDKIYREENRERFLEKGREYYKNNKQACADRRKIYYRKNSDRIKEYNRVRRVSLDKDEVRNYRRDYREKNLQRERERSRKHYEENRERYRQNTSLYYEKNKEAFILSARKRRHKEKLLNWEISDEHLNLILERFNNSCALTGDKNFHLDHVIPLHLGHQGAHIGNIIPLRSDLNISKGVKNFFKWFNENKERYELNEDKFKQVIEWLAHNNEITEEEYKDYLYWCHENPFAEEDLLSTDESEAI